MRHHEPKNEQEGRLLSHFAALPALTRQASRFLASRSHPEVRWFPPHLCCGLDNFSPCRDPLSPRPDCNKNVTHPRRHLPAPSSCWPVCASALPQCTLVLPVLAPPQPHATVQENTHTSGSPAPPRRSREFRRLTSSCEMNRTVHAVPCGVRSARPPPFIGGRRPAPPRSGAYMRLPHRTHAHGQPPSLARSRWCRSRW